MPGFTGYQYGDGSPNSRLNNMQQYAASYPSSAASAGINMMGAGYQQNNNAMFQPDRNGIGFAFKKRVDRIDWRKIAAIDVDRISRELDFNTLQENIMNLTFCNIESEVDVHTIDPNFLKLFKMAQLTIEYLLHSQDYLTNALAAQEGKFQKLLQENEELTNRMAASKQEVVDVKKECHKRKKLLVAQQQILQAGPDTYNKCPFCQKAFLSSSFLQSHIVRRHGEYASAFNGHVPHQQQQQVPVAASLSPTGSTNHNELLERELREIKERLIATESQLQKERNTLQILSQKETSKEVIKEKEVRSEIEQWKETQLEERKNELENVREMFMKELKEMNAKYEMSEQALLELQHRYGRKSNLGQLQDDNDGSISTPGNELLGSQKEEISLLKQQLKEQIEYVESSVRTRFDDQEKRMKTKMKSMARDHAQELARLNSALEQSSNMLKEEKMKRGEKTEKYEQAIEDLLQHSRDQEKLLRDFEADDNLVEEFRSETQRNELSKLQQNKQKKRSPNDDDERKNDKQKKHKRVSSPPLIEARDDSGLRAESSVAAAAVRSPRVAASTGSNKQQKRDVVDHRSSGAAYQQQTAKSTPKIVEQPPSSQASEPGETDEEETELEGAYGTAAFSTLGRSAELSYTTDDLVGTLIRGARLQQHLRKDPNILQGMKGELLDLLRDQLDERGITPDTTGISNVVLNNKLDLLDKERQLLSKKYKKFTEIRYQYEKRVDRLAHEQINRDKLKQQSSPAPNRSPPSPRKSTGTPKHSPNVARKSPRSPLRRSAPEGSTELPRPAPRTSQTMSTEASTLPTGSQWDTEDETDDESDAEDASAAIGSKSAAAGATGGTWPRRGGPQYPVIDMRPRAKSDNEDSEWDSEDISELQEKNPSTKHSNLTQPKNSSVTELSRSIEAQLQNRTGKSKPTGAVDTVPQNNVSTTAAAAAAAAATRPTTTNPQSKNHYKFDFDDDDDDLSLSISSLQDQPKPAPRPNIPSRSTQADTELSNTYGTSLWGSTSKGIANPKSSVSITDWDSDLDLDDLQ
ncbi:uncharacterized protein LOC141911004 isoform X2 [Tubulanus polymorphus]|uniref:uncharacterized protein LOC141911004 isoform X2 n=1 Tax=Tubulanus polymorphus TaxID=672921 RepID=UPI003DA3248E